MIHGDFRYTDSYVYVMIAMIILVMIAIFIVIMMFIALCIYSYHNYHHYCDYLLLSLSLSLLSLVLLLYIKDIYGMTMALFTDKFGKKSHGRNRLQGNGQLVMATLSCTQTQHGHGDAQLFLSLKCQMCA